MCVLVLPLLVSGMAAVGTRTTPRVTALTVEYLTAPIGVDKARPRFSWQLDASSLASSVRGIGPTGFRLQVSSDDFRTCVWDSGKVVSPRTNLIRYNGSSALVSDTHYAWRVMSWLANGRTTAWESSSFATALLGNEWKAAWITGGNNATLLRKVFDVAAGAAIRATLFVSGIGYSQVEIDGVRVSDHHLGSGWTDFSKRVLYSTFDVTHLIHPGKQHALGVSLGNGWFSCGNPPGTTQPACVNSPPQLLLQLHVNGEPIVVSDTTWRVAPGPITYNSLYNGEHYDGRRAQQLRGWSTVSFNATEWSTATEAASIANHAQLSAALFEPTRHLSKFVPRLITSPTPGVQVIDFGQNLAGLVQLNGLHCAAGTNVTLRHAELLTHPPYGPQDGTIYVGNLRGARATDVYTCAGDEAGESYVPTFTQHGFRYAEVSGLGFPLAEENIHAIEMHTDVRQHSSVVFSLPILNQIAHAVLWGQKTNLMSGVPTDCPNRDERRGWTGDTALTAEEAAYNYRMGAVYTRWLDQFEDAATPDGSSRDFVPSLGWKGPGSPNWQTAFPTLIWVLYHYYGDIDPAERHHHSLCKYYDNLISHYNRTGVGSFHQGNMFGDWVVPPPMPMGNKSLIASFALLHDLKMGLEFFNKSSVAGARAQSDRCAHYFARAAADFHAVFFNATRGWYGSGLQTEQVLPLFLDIVPSKVKADLVTYLVHDIVDTHGMHTTSGIVGIKAALEVLSREGRTDVALGMLQQTSYPSYGYMLRGGKDGFEPATTLWELWDADVEGPAMNSRNHIMFGSVMSWMYKALVGITPLQPGFTRVAIQPSGVGLHNLTSAEASVATPLGDVRLSWSLEAPGATCAASVPEGGEARVACNRPTDSIHAVAFASFGTPVGACLANGSSTFVSGACHANESAALVAKVCVGKVECTVLSDVSFFGDPCYGQAKHLDLAVTCARPELEAVTQVLHVAVSVPAGAVARLVLPLIPGGRDASKVSVTETDSGLLVWSGGSFVPGVQGLSGAKATLAGIEMDDVASGTYHFALG